MEEKKLTDEEIVKAWELCLKEGPWCRQCPYILKGINCLNSQHGIDTLDLIHRLQEENKRLKENNANQVRMRCDMQRKFDDLQNLCIEQKEEIERLTEEKKEVWDERNRICKGYWETMDGCHQYREKILELQKQVDELKEQIKNLTSSCQSKNAKIKNLNAEKESLQNELNFQNGKPHYRYVIWNTKQNKRQFPSICELTESGAYTKLFQKIGWDSAKYRFEVRRIKIDGVEVE